MGKLTRGRVVSIRVGKRAYLVRYGDNEVFMSTVGALSSPPVVGDWVMADPERLRIDSCLPRANHFSRRRPGRASREQVVAANLDFVFVVMGQDEDYNLNRLARYLTLAQAGGVVPVVILNKCDLVEDTAARLAQVKSEFLEVEAFSVSASKRIGVESLERLLEPSRTALLCGSSGAGKSTLVNYLVGSEVAETLPKNERSGRGRAVTTNRYIHITSNGGYIIDSPGMMEVQLWGAEDSARKLFADLAELEGNCRYRNCQHQGESGCAFQHALSEGHVSFDRFQNYLEFTSSLKGEGKRQYKSRRKRS